MMFWRDKSSGAASSASHGWVMQRPGTHLCGLPEMVSAGDNQTLWLPCAQRKRTSRHSFELRCMWVWWKTENTPGGGRIVVEGF